MARVCAETCLKPVFKAISHLIKKYQNKKKMIRIYNKFVEMDPAMWSDAYDMSINVGLGSGTARQTTENIERLMAVQEKMVAGGGLGTLLLPQNLYAAAVRHAETIGFKDASAFFNDPSSVEPMPPEPSIEDKQLATLKEIEQLKALLKKLERLRRGPQDAPRDIQVPLAPSGSRRLIPFAATVLRSLALLR